MPETLVIIVKYAETCSVSIDAVPVDLHTSHKQTVKSVRQSNGSSRFCYVRLEEEYGRPSGVGGGGGERMGKSRPSRQ